MRAARAARGDFYDTAVSRTGADAPRIVRSKGTSPAPFPEEPGTMSRTPASSRTKPFRKNLHAKRSRTVARATRSGEKGGRKSLPHDAAYPFPMPYPGVDRGRPRAPTTSARGVHCPERRPVEEIQAVPPRPGRSTLEKRPGTAVKRRKRPRSAVVTARFRAGPDASLTRPPVRSARMQDGYGEPPHSSRILGHAEWRDTQTTADRDVEKKSSKKMKVRPLTAPSRRRDGDELGRTGNGNALARSGSPGGRREASTELPVMKWVVLRETYLEKLHGVVSIAMRRAACGSSIARLSSGTRKASPEDRPKLFTLLTELLTVLRRITVEIVEAVQRWRRANNGGRKISKITKPFMWGSSNYLLKAARDVNFLARLPGLEQHLGITITDNPFLCRTCLDGTPASFTPRTERGDVRQRGCLGRDAQNTHRPINGSGGSLGVSAERVEAATAVVYAEVLRAGGKGGHAQYRGRLLEPTRISQADNLRRNNSTSTSRAAPERSSECISRENRLSSSEQGLRPAGGLRVPPRDDYSLDGQDETECHQDKESAGAERPTLSSEEGNNDPSEGGAVFPSQTTTQRIGPPPSERSSSKHNVGAKLGDRDTSLRQEENFYYQDGVVYREDEFTGEWRRISQSDDPRWANSGSRRPSTATSLIEPSLNAAIDSDESPAASHIPEPCLADGSDTVKPPGPSSSNEIDTVDRYAETKGGRMGRRGSPFMEIFNMCDGMLTDLQGFGRAGNEHSQSVAELPELGDYPVLLTLEEGRENGGGRVGFALDEEGDDETQDASVLRGTAYEGLTKSLCAGKMAKRKATTPDQQEESDADYIERLKQDTPDERKAKHYTAWAERTAERLLSRDRKAAKHHRRSQLRRGLSVWENHRGAVLQASMAEAFAGRFGLNQRFFVRCAFDALRAQARGARIAARNRSVMKFTCALLESVGRARERQAWQRWVQRIRNWSARSEGALLRLGELWAKGRLRGAFDTWRRSLLPPSTTLKQTRSVAALRSTLKTVGSFVSAVAVSSKNIPTTASAISPIDGAPEPRSNLDRQSEDESWTNWLRDEGSQNCPATLPRARPARQAGTEQARAVGRLPYGIGAHAGSNENEAEQTGDERQALSPTLSLRGLGAKLKSLKSFRDIRDKSQAQRRRLHEDIAAVDVIGVFRSPGQQPTQCAAGRIQRAWRASRERRVETTVTNSALVVQAVWRLHSRRRHAAHRITRVWRQRACSRAKTLHRALTEAAGEGDLRVVAFLLRPMAGWNAGADVNARGIGGGTALHAATRSELHPVSTATMPNIQVSGGAARAACSGRELDALRTMNKLEGEDGLPIHSRHGLGRSERRDWVGVIRALVEAGAAVEARDDKGRTPMMVAAEFGGKGAISALAEAGGELDAAESGSGKRTPLVIASQKSNIPATAALLEYGARVNLAAADGLTPLHEAVGAGSIAVAEMLVRRGAKVDVRNSSAGMTPLHLAVANDQHAAARLLVHSGADVCLPDARGLTPLRLTVEMQDAPTVALLLAAEPPADLSVRDQSGSTVLHAACRLGLTDIARLLLEAGADAHSRDARGRTPELVALDLGHSECAALFYNVEIHSFMPSRRDREDHDSDGSSVDHGYSSEVSEGNGNRKMKPLREDSTEHRRRDSESERDRQGKNDGNDDDDIIVNDDDNARHPGERGQAWALQDGGDALARDRSLVLHNAGVVSAEDEKEEGEQKEQWTWTADGKWQKSSDCVSETVAVARRASFDAQFEQQQHISKLLPMDYSKSGDVPDGQNCIIKENQGAHCQEDSRQGDEVDGSEGEWEWSETTGWQPRYFKENEQASSLVLTQYAGQGDDGAETELSLNPIERRLSSVSYFKVQPEADMNHKERRGDDDGKDGEGRDVSPQERWAQTPDGNWAIASYACAVGKEEATNQQMTEGGNDGGHGGEWVWSDTEGWHAASSGLHVSSSSLQSRQLAVVEHVYDRRAPGRRNSGDPHQSEPYPEWEAGLHDSNNNGHTSADENGWLQAPQEDYAVEARRDAAAQGDEGEGEARANSQRRELRPREYAWEASGGAASSGRDGYVRENLDHMDESTYGSRLAGYAGDVQDVNGRIGYDSSLYNGSEQSRNAGYDQDGHAKDIPAEPNAASTTLIAGQSVESRQARSEGGRFIGWGGVAAVFRAKDKWFSLIDRESGSIYYQNQRSGLTQWEVPGNGAVIESEGMHGDDASIE